jgi:DNA-binding MarR family transcriptional regulator
MKARSGPEARSRPAPAALLLGIADRIPRLFFKLRAVGDRVYGPLGIATSERGVLRDLAGGERLTAPQLAALRPVSRQALQPVLAGLLERGLVATRPNPRKRRSPYYGITRAGRAMLAEGRARELALLSGRLDAFDREDLACTLELLSRLETALAETLAEWGATRADRAAARG